VVFAAEALAMDEAGTDQSIQMVDGLPSAGSGRALRSPAVQPGRFRACGLARGAHPAILDRYTGGIGSVMLASFPRLLMFLFCAVGRKLSATVS
jgi:hypothetical protein